MTTKNYPTIRVTAETLRAALDEYEPDPIPCLRCDCALVVRTIRPGLIEGLCHCCAGRWLLEVER